MQEVNFSLVLEHFLYFSPLQNIRCFGRTDELVAPSTELCREDLPTLGNSLKIICLSVSIILSLEYLYLLTANEILYSDR